jgi:hypothetical protein
MSEEQFKRYLSDRVDDQLKYFDSSAIKNSKWYKRLKLTSISCNVLTTMTIALAFTVKDPFKMYLGIIALILSTIVLGTYQLEEFQNFGAKWEKFRLIAEQIKSEKLLFLTNAGPYTLGEVEGKQKRFIESIEAMIRGTDLTYFTLIVEPGKRIEKRLQQ